MIAGWRYTQTRGIILKLCPQITIIISIILPIIIRAELELKGKMFSFSASGFESHIQFECGCTSSHWERDHFQWIKFHRISQCSFSGIGGINLIKLCWDIRSWYITWQVIGKDNTPASWSGILHMNNAAIF